ncbi:MAG: hypothetical protein RLZZ28_1036 [Bacteroidota bacterium]
MLKLLGLVLCGYLIACQVCNAQNVLDANEYERQLSMVHPQLLDVRTAGEYQLGHLKNALQADWTKADQFKDRIKYLDKTKPLFVYCASGARSAAAAKWLLDNGFNDVQNLAGGLLAWKNANKPVEGQSNKLQLSVKAYEELTKTADVVLVDFGADWCPPCKKMEPVLEQLKTDLQNQYTLVKVDGGLDFEVMKQMQVEALPVFILYKKGKEVWRNNGVVGLEELKKQIQ